mgnify:FL=1
MILDTSFVIDLIRSANGAPARLEDVQARRLPQKLSAITLLELYEGVRRTDRSEAERESVLEVLDSKAVVPADQSIMRRAGELSVNRYVDGTPIEREDCIVGATALLEDEPVLTRNANHFERIPEVEVVSY